MSNYLKKVTRIQKIRNVGKKFSTCECNCGCSNGPNTNQSACNNSATKNGRTHA